MPRIKFRDFSGGFHVTAQPDLQPRNSLRMARNIAPPVAGRLRAASCPLTRKSGVVISVDNVFRYQNIYFAEGTSAGVHIIRRDNGADVWTTVTLPAAVGAGTTYISTAVVGTQPVVLLFPSSRSTSVFAPTVDGRKEVLFLIDRANNGPYAIKITNPTTGACSRWGILPPVSGEVTGMAPTLATQDTAYINTANADFLESSADWTLASADETALNAATAITTSANPAIDGNSIKFVVGRDDNAQITRVLASPINLNTFPVASGGSGGASTDEDFISFFIRIRRPKHIVNVEVAFDTNAGDFKSDFFTRELTFKLVKKRQRRKLIGLGDLVPVKNTQQFLKDNQDKLKDLTFTQDQGVQKIPVAKNTWTRVTLPKSTFEQSGVPSWATVRAVRFTAQTNKQGKTAIFLDSLKQRGGVGMVGDYQYTTTWLNNSTGTRSNPNITQDGVITHVNISNVERQGVTLTFSTMIGDPQADRLEVWRTVGNGKAYFKVGYIALTTPGSVTAGTFFTDLTSDYVGLNSSAATYTQAMGATGTWNGNSILDPSLELPIDNDSPNDPTFNFQDAVGIHAGRMWWTRNISTGTLFTAGIQDAQGQVYYSPIARYEAVQAFIQVSSGTSDPVQKLIIWNDRLFALTGSAFYEIVGNDEPFVAQKVEGAPGTLWPDTVVSSQQGIFYRAVDGVYNFNGQYAQNITDKDLQPIFKWRESVADIGTTNVNFTEAAIGQNAYWIMTRTGVYPLLILDFETKTWRESQPGRFLKWDFIAGQMLGVPSDASAGKIYDLEPTPFNSTRTTTHHLRIMLPTVRAGTGQHGIIRKVFIDYDPQGDVILPIVYADGSVSGLELTTLVSTIGRRQAEFTVNVPFHDFQFELFVTNVDAPVEIYGVEFDIYVPGLTIQESGIAGNE